MVICKLLKKIESVIYVTEGYGKKEKKVPLYTIKIPSQKIVFSLTENKLIENPIEIQVKIHTLEKPSFIMRELQNVARSSADIEGPITDDEGHWPLQTFSDFVDGVKAVTDKSKQYLEANAEFIAEAEITDTTYVWSICKQEKVSGGLFSKDEYQTVQKISFNILGLESGFVRWENDMLNSIETLKENIEKQIEEFVSQINVIKKEQ